MKNFTPTVPCPDVRYASQAIHRGHARALQSAGKSLRSRLKHDPRKFTRQSPREKMNLEQIDHIALRCASPEATMAWYVRTLGFEQVFPDQWDGIPLFLRLGSTYLALFPEKQPERALARSPVSHLAFRAATYADFRAAQVELTGRGIAFQFQDHAISHSIYFSDPDGFHLEITTYDLADAARTNPPTDQATEQPQL
jgi:catechol 2,3-dioxygenase-like lactoylglutathione lyase family enzyme